MKTKSPLKIIFAFLGLVILMSAIVLVVAKKNLKPEMIRTAFTEQLQKALPNAEVITQSLDYSLGVSSKVNIRKVEILYPHGGRKLPLTSFDNLQIEVPFWTMLLGYGTININIDSPKLSFIQLKKGSNWENARELKKVVSFSEKKKPKSSTPKDENSSGSLAVLGFFADATLNLNVTNINANYSLTDGDNGEVKINKLAVHDIGLNTTTVVELKSTFNLFKGRPNQTSFDFLIIGETKLENWLKDQTLLYNAEISINKIKSKSLIKEIKSILINVDGGIKKKLIDSAISVSLEEHQFMKSKLSYDMAKSQFRLHQINLDADLNNLLAFIVNIADYGAKIKTGRLKLEGAISSQNGKLTPDLTTTINSDLEVLGESLKVTVKNNLNKKQIRSAIEINAFDGEIKIGQSTPFILGVDRFDYLKTSTVNMFIKDVVIPTAFKNSMPKTKAIEETPSTDEESKTISNTEGEIFSKFPVKSKIRFSNTMLGQAPLNGQIFFSVNRKKMNISSNKLKLGTAPLNIKLSSKIEKNKTQTVIDSNFTGVDISSTALFVPDQLIKSISGKATGSVVGKTQGNEYDFNVKLIVDEAKFDKINLSKIVGNLFDKIKKYTKKEITVNGEINKISFEGHLDDRQHLFKNYQVVLDNGDFVLDGKGKIDFKTNGELLGNVIINEKEIKHDLERDYGTSHIPFRLEGVGYNLSSDYQYTIEEVAKSASKNLIKKESQKILDKNKKKVKKLFKGLFQ